MHYETNKNSKITVFDLTQFDINHILDCGQTFRYRNGQNCHTVFSKNKNCVLQKQNECVIIETEDTDYFVNYFDLNRDYGKIKSNLKSLKGLEQSLEFGSGIRILNQDPYEMIISFIISANNNIPRIKGIIERICENLGDKNSCGFAFPSPEQLAQADRKFFESIGAGYRASYLEETSRKLVGYDLNTLYNMSTAEARKVLMSFKGIGGKVADCILLFAYHKTDLFPMDTWSKKIYNALGYADETVPDKMSKRLVNTFGDLSGYAQQYLYYFYRTNKI